MPRTHANISTIFIGGGTPSIYPSPLIKELFSTLKKYFDFDGIKEITIETNPADITEEKLDTWKELGINRLSIGVQVLDDKVLAKLNRHQRTTDVQNAMRMAPKYFENISIDLILGLPGVTARTWDTTIATAMSWPIQHISMYFLMVYEKTPLYFKLSNNEYSLTDESSLLQAFEKTTSTLKNNGFKHYETSNYAHPGFHSLHNLGYWNYKPYKGFGLGASSFDGTIRTINEKNLQRYINNTSNNDFRRNIHQEPLSPEQKKIERFMLGLRQTRGMGLHDMVYLLNEDEKPRFFKNLEELKAKSLIEEHNERISLTLKGMLVENEIILRLI